LKGLPGLVVKKKEKSGKVTPSPTPPTLGTGKSEKEEKVEVSEKGVKRNADEGVKEGGTEGAGDGAEKKRKIE